MSRPSDRPCDVLLTFPREQVNIFESMIPLGLAGIGAVLEQRGYGVRVVDFAHYTGDFRRDLRRWQPKVIGIGGTTSTRRGSFLTSRLVKETLPNVPVVYGGVHASFAAEDTLTHVPQMDYIVKGEGEYVFADLCDRLIAGSAQGVRDLPGLSFRESCRIVHNPAHRIEVLDELPLPARHLFGGNYGLRLDFSGTVADFLMTSRGCPAACTFCSASRMFPGGVRYRSMEHVRTEVEQILSRKKVGALKLFDSTFTADQDHVRAFCEMVRPYNLLWECEIRADTVDLDLLRVMRAAGCCYVNVGLETTDEGLLKRMCKGIPVRQVESVLEWCKRLEIKTKVFFTFGHLQQTYGQCCADIDYIRRLKGHVDFFATTVGMRVFPGTSLERQAQRAGLISGDFSWARFRPSVLNWLLLEFGDVLILRQKQLSLRRLVLVAILLVMQRTVTSTDYLKKLVTLNVTRLWGTGVMRVRHLGHVARRSVERVWA